MKRISGLFLRSFCLVFCWVVLGCTQEAQPLGLADDDEEEDALVIVNVWEDRLEEIRMIVFDPGTGTVVLNQPLYFPNGFTQSSKAVRMKPGDYNFCFIANEMAYTGDFVAALEEITNQSELTTDPRFNSLAYRPDFMPDEDTDEGLFLMSAWYDNITVPPGGTEDNPILLALPTSTVELVRALAKVEVIFHKRVPGSVIPENTITSVQLQELAATYSVPPADTYYTGTTTDSPQALLNDLDYDEDEIGSVVFYVPERLIPESSAEYMELHINNQVFPVTTDAGFDGLSTQRRTVAGLSPNSVIRNYHYQINVYINAEGSLEIQVHVEPWRKDSYLIIFQGDQHIVIPPVEPTDSSIIIPTECGRIEIHSNNEELNSSNPYLTTGSGLQGAYNDVVNYYDPDIQGPTIYRGKPPFYCEKKYGEGWRLINSCELLSFLGYCDVAYNVWTSNTYLAADHNLPYYALPYRQEAQTLLQLLTGEDLSATVLYPTHNNQDQLSDEKVNLIDKYFTPGDIVIRQEDFPNNEWPYTSPPGTDLEWFYNEVTIQVKAYWYSSGYLSPAVRANWNTILYNEFERYDFSSTVSRCVRAAD